MNRLLANNLTDLWLGESHLSWRYFSEWNRSARRAIVRIVNLRCLFCSKTWEYLNSSWRHGDRSYSERVGTSLQRQEVVEFRSGSLNRGRLWSLLSIKLGNRVVTSGFSRTSETLVPGLTSPSSLPRILAMQTRGDVMSPCSKRGLKTEQISNKNTASFEIREAINFLCKPSKKTGVCRSHRPRIVGCCAIHHLINVHVCSQLWRHVKFTWWRHTLLLV